ncbi:16S rRNA (cytidine(1402)-2'-O)-methyltransferase [Marinibacterium profundimaris]|uniref:Ribosomal RNA small subunit methyltransferase I n=1 Tax=Marinibacterium profundimaris TaxID=1679460 RepID=A0A225NM88_9RHOB|nr:16S rRNA (cytidine(1402)-2'-O)-methyltransferase [Marinibacterium profundimaris]OWU73309.1 16S rRNA methyltransferase [Marinibacterium profundimaris]
MNFRTEPLAPGLYFVGTPIGTARDITLRALDVLASADVLAAEDTRSLRRLMEIHGVPMNGRTVLSYHDHSGDGARARLMAALADGQSVAYASEAGMPLIADPGYALSRAAAEAGHRVTSAPGPSALLTALTLAGLPTDAFFFDGFLPSAKGARRSRLEALRAIPGTLIFYESPKRIAQALEDAAEVLGPDRPAVVARELTKKFEELRRGSLQELAENLAENPVKGEIVLLVDRGSSESVNQGDIESDLREALTTMTLRDAADLVSRAHGLPRRKVYQTALKLEKDGT